MSTNRENLENPGIFVRVFDETHQVRWIDGRGLIEAAYQEELDNEDSIADFLRGSSATFDFEQDDYDEWGNKTATLTLRSITLREAVHFLGRRARICAFLRPKAQAHRFMNALEKGGSLVELQVAAEIRRLLPRFEKIDEILLAERLSDYLEEQLLNITSGSFEP
ncbi:MAG: hypothetical protein FWC43_01230 [Planctomycetaceae bacterium]|nr:hypothetical protein [Planctomycetaceae bacterium]